MFIDAHVRRHCCHKLVTTFTKLFFDSENLLEKHLLTKEHHGAERNPPNLYSLSYVVNCFSKNISVTLSGGFFAGS